MIVELQRLSHNPDVTIVSSYLIIAFVLWTLPPLMLLAGLFIHWKRDRTMGREEKSEPPRTPTVPLCP